jgi:DNA polymerase elongation subunit (family B)
MERLVAYGLDDVRETREISRVLGQSHFHQTQMFPMSHQNTITRGNATRIDALFLREYLRRRCSIPKPPEKSTFQGGYTDLFIAGVVSPVIHCDVQSLYPSVMLAYGITPRRDALRVFPALLADLTQRRVDAKTRARVATATAEKTFYGALQSTLKVLINSFYGYLGFPQGHFADFEAAARVTAEGRALIHRVLEELRSKGATPVEVDTDGVYFVPPADIRSEEGEVELVAEVSRVLPDGIRLELADRYRAMFSYKIKNYVLLTYSGDLRVRGSGLRSRGMEKFQRLLLEEIFRAVLERRPEDILVTRDLFLEDVRQHRWTPDLFAKTETLHDSLAVYREKRSRSSRNASAAYELALASGRSFQPGDQVTYYVSGRGKTVRVFECARFASDWDAKKPDENTEYYVKKVEDLCRKFQPLLKSPTREAPPELDLDL